MAPVLARRVTSLFLLFLGASAQLRVMTPDWLVGQFQATHGRIEGSTATFGAPFFGDRILGRVLWGESLHGHNHCQEDDYELPAHNPALKGGEKAKADLISIVVVRRGLCSFVTKARVAAKKGAHAVIIVDREDSTLTSEDLRNIIVGDDGYGDQVHVPSMLISHKEGQRLIEAVPAAEVVVELAWDVPADHVVNMDLWMSSGSAKSLSFLKQFSEKRKTLNEVVKFTPHYVVFGMEPTGIHVYNKLCLDDTAQLCTEDPDASGPVTGRDVLNEDARQLCIHELTRVVSKTTAVEYAEKFWNYVEMLPEHCPLDGDSEDTRFGSVCSEALMRKVGLDVDAVSHCVQNTRHEKLAHERENTAWSPRALRINGWRYTGSLDADLVTRAVCAGFLTQPEECTSLLKPRNPFIPDSYKHQDQGMSVGAFIGATVIIVSSMLVAFLLYKRALKKQLERSVREEVMLEVQSQMGQYSKMLSSF